MIKDRAMKLFRNLLWLFLPVLLLACSNDETNGENNGEGNTDPDRREIVIELQNGLRPVSTTRAPIAEADENHIRSLDIYAFACSEEEGHYTFADRFCYRADDYEVLPAGAKKLTFKYDESNGQARVVFYPRKGLYYHFFCVANSSTLNSDDNTPYTRFTPLVMDNVPGEGNTGVPVKTAGVPNETDFVNLFSPALKGGEGGDVMQTPLTMSGATLLPIDLRNTALGSSIRLNMRLTRAVARFDVVNNVLESHFTITHISLDRGRRRVSLFPITPSDGTDGELITYADAVFDSPTANLGTTKKAFYCYPSPEADGAALILKGHYALNQTDTPVEVAYRVPFEQTVDGTGSRIDVVHNHRYTLLISKADPYKLDCQLKVEDWADEGNLDHNLDNQLEELKVAPLLPADKTTYNPLTETVIMSIDPAQGESSFALHTASNTGVSASLAFVAATADQHWLRLEEMMPDADYEHKGSQAAKFKVSLIPDYAGDSYPRALLQLVDGSGKFEKTVIILPEPYPIPFPITPLPDAAGGKLNKYDTVDKTLHLYRVKGSTVQLKLSCTGGITVADDLNAWLKVERTGGTEQASIFTLTLTDPDVVLTDDRAILTFSNKEQPELKQEITLLLHEAGVTDLAISDHDGLSSLDAEKKEVEMTVTLNSKFRLSARAYDDVTVEKVEYTNGPHGKVDEWLEYSVDPVTRTAGNFDNLLAQTLEERMKLGWQHPGTKSTDNVTTRSVTLPVKEQNNITFSMKSTAQYFGPATVTLKNACLGPDLVLKVLPEYPVPVVSASTPMTPTPNNYDDANKTLYLLQQADGKTSVATLSVYSPGGSSLALPSDASGLTLNRTTGELPTEKYTLSWKGTNSTLADHDVTLQVKNASDPTQIQNITVKALSTDISDLSLAPKETNSAALDVKTKAITVNMKEANSFTLNMKAYGGQVTVESCPSFLTPPAVTRGMPSKTQTSLTFTLKSGNAAVNGKGAENLVLTNPSGGPKLTLSVTPVYIAPTVSGAGTMTPANANKWDATDNTLYLVQQAAGKTSSGILTVYSLGGSAIEPPAGVTASLLNSDEKSQQYELRWAGSNANNLTTQNLTLKLKNKSDATKTKDVKMQLLPNIISNLALTPKAAGTASLNGATVTVDIAADNWFKLTTKAYGNGTRVTVKSKPDWLKASTPATTRTAPVQEQTAITFTVDGSKTAFTEGNIVLASPSGGPDLTVRVKPNYMTPSYNSSSAFTTCNSYSSNTLNLVQPRSGSSNGTLRFYALGGSRAELISATDGLTISGNALSATTLHDYQLKWTPTNPNNARSDQSITLKVYNYDNSKFLTQTIKLVANGSLDISNSLNKWDTSPSRTGAVALSAALNINIVANATFDISTGSYGGMTVVDQPAWLSNTKTESPAITSAYPQKISSKFHFTIKTQNGSYPAGTVKLRPVLGGPDCDVTIRPVYQAPTITAGTMNPSGLNNYDAAQNTVYLIQQKSSNSTAQLNVYALGGNKVTWPAYSGFSITPSGSSNHTNIYTLTWNASSGVQAAKDISLTFANNSDNAKTKVITAKLLPNTLRNVKLTAQSGGVSLSPSPMASGTSATLTVPIVKGVGFTVSMDCYGGTPGVKTCPAWLQKGAVTRAAPTNQTHTFRFDLIENAANFNDTQIVFTNPSGGPELTLNITRVFQTPTITAVSMDPAANSYVPASKSLNLYQLKSAYSSTATLKVYSLGGSKLELPLGVAADLMQSTTKEQTYVISYKTSNLSLTDVSGGTLYAKNLSDEAKSQAIPITFKSSVPVVTSNLDGKGLTFSRTTSDVDVTVRPQWETYDITGFTFTFTSPIGYTFASIGTGGSANTYTEISTGSQSGSTGSIKNNFTLSFKSTASFSNSPNLYYYTFSAKDDRFPSYMIDLYMQLPVYKGKTPYKLNGLYALPAYPKCTWDEAVSAGNSAGYGWRLASMEDYRKLVGWTGSDYDNYDINWRRGLNADPTYIGRIFKYGNVDSGDSRHWSSNDNGYSGRTLDLYSTTEGRYEHPPKTDRGPYVLVHDE